MEGLIKRIMWEKFNFKQNVSTLNNYQQPQPFITWFRAENHELLPSILFLVFLSTLLGIKEELLLWGAPIQRLELSIIEGNLWELRGWHDAPGGESWEQVNSGLHNGVVNVGGGSGTSLEQVQNDRDKLVLAISLAIGFVLGSLTNETMPFRQSGHAIEPGGPLEHDDVQFVEQRYSAQHVQNSWSQPSTFEIMCLT